LSIWDSFRQRFRSPATGFEGKIASAVTQAVANGLKKNAISEIDAEAVEKSVGWTSFGSPFQPSFDENSFAFGNLFVFFAAH